MRIFPYEVGDPAKKPNDRMVIEFIDGSIWVAIFDKGFVIWRGTSQQLGEFFARFTIAA